MKRTMVVVACLLAGCTTQQDLIDRGERSTVTLTRPPEQAAGCVARNVENRSPPLIASVRAAEKGGSYEVVVRAAADVSLGYVLIAPATNGSIATMWLREAWFYGKAELVAVMTKGC